jgi:hypothetical protein
MMRDKAGVFIKGHIPLPPETVEDSQKSRMFLVDAHPDEIDNRNVMSWLTSSAEA